jgi:Flp pilus assembly protein TadD
MALNAQGTANKIDDALRVLSDASVRDPKNPQLSFQRAHILFTQNRLEEALADLLKVEEAAPKEAPVHAMLGQIYQRLGDVQKSMLHLNIALDLEPKEANKIRVSTKPTACSNGNLHILHLLIFFFRRSWTTTRNLI